MDCSVLTPNDQGQQLLGSAPDAERTMGLIPSRQLDVRAIGPVRWLGAVFSLSATAEKAAQVSGEMVVQPLERVLPLAQETLGSAAMQLRHLQQLVFAGILRDVLLGEDKVPARVSRANWVLGSLPTIAG